MPKLAPATIKESQFANTYGGLSLVRVTNGQQYLEMQDCFGPEYFGPLTEEQISAFETLCEVPYISYGKFLSILRDSQ